MKETTNYLVTYNLSEDTVSFVGRDDDFVATDDNFTLSNSDAYGFMEDNIEFAFYEE